MRRLKGILEGTVLAPKESVEKLSFFYFKYKGKGIWSEKGRHKIRPDLFKLAVIMLNDAPLVQYTNAVKDLDRIYKTTDVCQKTELVSMLMYISFMDDLQCFYDLNKDTSHGIIDKRTHLFEMLKRRGLRSISFLRNRTKKKSIKDRTHSLKGILNEVDRLINLSEED